MIRRAQRGVTLIELIVVLALLGIMAGMAGLAFGAAEPLRPLDERTMRIAAARHQAVQERRSVTVEFQADGGPYMATAWPDGRVVADPALGIELLTGRGESAR